MSTRSGDLASNELTCYDVLEDSKNGIEQVIHCFIHGTNDLKALLLQYTDLVFECRNCRRLFRSLPNFVRHKETDCEIDLKTGLNFSGNQFNITSAPNLKEILNWEWPKPSTGAAPSNSSENLKDGSTAVPPTPELMHSPTTTSNGNANPLPTSSASTSQAEPLIDHAKPQEGDGEEVVVLGPVCPICNKAFATKNNCRRHVREMHGMQPVSSSKGKSQLVHHIKEERLNSNIAQDEFDGEDETYKKSDEEEIECPICGIKINEKSILRRHLIDEHHLSLMDACSILAKEIPLSNSLPTLVRPIGLNEPTSYAEDEGSVPPSKRKTSCPLCGLILYDRWTARRHLVKLHGKCPQEADKTLAQFGAAMGISPPTTPTPTQKKETKKEKRKSVDSIGPTIEPKISKVLPAKVSSNDPDKIACPICAKLWHKSNLRNHLFYGHHMKTSEVEAVLIRLKDPNSIAKQETTVNERTPCPLCDRSFKHWYNARRHLREGHGIPHDETVRMIRPPSEIRRKAIDNLIVEAANSDANSRSLCALASPPADEIEPEDDSEEAIEEESIVPTVEDVPVTDELRPSCPLCQNAFNCTDLLRKHLKQVHSCSDVTIKEAIAPYAKVATKPKPNRTILIQLRTGSIVKVKIIPGAFKNIPNNKCPRCNLILSSRVSMKQHIMELHHVVYDEDPDWLELMVEDEKNKYYQSQGMKCGVDDEVRSNTSSTSDLDGEIKCPICRSKFMHIHALKYHLKTTHKKKQKKEIEDLVQLGKEELEKKRPRLEGVVEQPTSTSCSARIQAPIIPATIVEDDSHFLLSRDLKKPDHRTEVKTEVKRENDGSVPLSETEPNGKSDPSDPIPDPPTNGHLANGQHVKEEGTIKATIVNTSVSTTHSPDSRPKLIMSIKKSDLKLTF